MEPLTLLWAVLILAGLGLLFGIGLGIASKYLHVVEDNRKEEIVAILPNANCGACGYPGCAGYADAILAGKAENLSLCKPGLKAGVPAKLRQYLDEHPNPDGSVNQTKLN